MSLEAKMLENIVLGLKHHDASGYFVLPVLPCLAV